MNPNATSSVPETKLLWWAYAFAPAVAPIVFAITVFLLGTLLHDATSTGTPIGIVLIPLASLTVGILASYVIAGFIGMPIAFFLRKRNKLNGFTIHGAALAWTVVMIGLPSTVMYAVASAQRPLLIDFLVSTLVMVAIIAPFVLLSATTFWWIVSRDRRTVSLRTLFIIITLVAMLAAVLTAWLRPMRTTESDADPKSQPSANAAHAI
ncbi:MAG: hypothetical protein ACI87E_004002 [Mariniblastus sp.]|jgi:hypothetical protein